MSSIPKNPGVTHVLFHGNCYDGFTAAWIARNAGVPEQNLIPCHYGGKSFPDVPSEAKVLMVDFSYDRPILQVMKDSIDDLIVLDHHRTAEAQLHGLDWAYFDMEESGASLAWKFFHPDQAVPRFVDYIREHDLWRFELPNSAQIRAYIRSYEMDFEAWDRLNTTIVMDTVVAVREGYAIERGQAAAVSAMVEQAVMIKVGGHTVPVVNATIYFSEVATRLLKLHPEAQFAAYYMDRADGMRQWGMRSNPDFDCSKVAKRYGGGGHQQAAGFTTEVPKQLDMEPRNGILENP
jgi:oligoribonuclease NrnB/cAMP/cGMP phosphodiesterase (DHH superfamily)